MSEFFTHAIYALLLGALFLACGRLILGPTTADRVVALELIASILIGMMAAYALIWEVPAALDAALVLALTGFLAAIAVSRYIEKRGGSAGGGAS
ncbi:MAG: monovalent cation/H+ antiporter complex subunit F [Gammaproteobacteria bacterium]|jgi:multicomponent Na+:H+ antiporter subunit F